MRDVTLATKTPLTGGISEFTLHADDLPAYTPGAHIDVDLPGIGLRSYSLIDWPGEQDGDTNNGYRIAVQREDAGDGGSKAMHDLQAGQTLSISDPKNSFELRADGRPVLLLAGGIGITPLISMASALSAGDRDVTLVYCGRTRDQMAYLDALTATFGAALAVHVDDETPVDLAALMAGHTGHSLYICGPRGMIDAARQAAEAAGLDPAHIHVELFATPDADTDADGAFEVEVASTGQVVTVAADQSIVEALEEAGLDPIYDCQRGDCGICQTDVISGIPDHRDVVLSQAERDSGKTMQICVSRAKSPRLVLDL